MEQKNGSYEFTIDLKVKRIEVYSFSNQAAPYYWVETNDGYKPFGGALLGSLRDIDDPLFAAREDKAFILNVLSMHSNYDYAIAHKRKVADSGEIDGRVLIDAFKTDEGLRFAVRGSNLVYGTADDGRLILFLGEKEVGSWIGQ